MKNDRFTVRSVQREWKGGGALERMVQSKNRGDDILRWAHALFL